MKKLMGIMFVVALCVALQAPQAFATTTAATRRWQRVRTYAGQRHLREVAAARRRARVPWVPDDERTAGR